MSALPVGEVIAASVYLHPGQLFVSSEPVVVTTILGSCVAVCLWDPQAGVAGINHFLLASTPVRGAADARYGNVAMAQLMEAMLARGAATSRIVAKVFGGACVLDKFTGARQSIGELNIATAREYLERCGIALRAEHTGGRRGRKLVFHTDGGSAYVKEL